MELRQPILVVLGHVDHGKTLLLDKIRGTAVQAREAGGITQHIGASMLPRETILEICGDLLAKFGFRMEIPGLLVIDTPGHEIFSNLRVRGGSAADFAILVIDVIQGCQPQTHEALEILLRRKVPFVIAANKVDLIPGWRDSGSLSIMESLKVQREEVVRNLEERLLRIIEVLSYYNLTAERFDRVRDFRREVAIVPTSAVTGEGIKELLAIIVGLTQKFMSKRLTVIETDVARGSVLEVAEEVGHGHVIKGVLIDGVLREGDYLMVYGRDGPIVTKIKALLMPAPLDEIRDPRKRLVRTEEVRPAAGVMISAPNLEEALAGSSFFAFSDPSRAEELKGELLKEVSAIQLSSEINGVILKADTLGSLEAMLSMCRRRNIPVRKTEVGDVTRTDVIEADIVGDKERVLGAILGFNVKVLPDAKEEARVRNVPIFIAPILYEVFERYERWKEEEIEKEKRATLATLTLPGVVEVLPGFVFRRSNPAIFGVRVIHGVIRPKVKLINKEGRTIGPIHQIQDRGESIPEAKSPREVAISIQKAAVGRGFDEGDKLYVDVPFRDAKIIADRFWGELDESTKKALLELAELKLKLGETPWLYIKGKRQEN